MTELSTIYKLSLIAVTCFIQGKLVELIVALLV